MPRERVRTGRRGPGGCNGSRSSLRATERLAGYCWTGIMVWDLEFDETVPPICHAFWTRTTKVRPVLGFSEQKQLDEASNRIPPTTQVSEWWTSPPSDVYTSLSLLILSLLISLSLSLSLSLSIHIYIYIYIEREREIYNYLVRFSRAAALYSRRPSRHPGSGASRGRPRRLRRAVPRAIHTYTYKY